MKTGQVFGYLLDDEVQPLFAKSISLDDKDLIAKWFTPFEQVKIQRLNPWRQVSRMVGHIAAKKVLTAVLEIAAHEIVIDHHPSGAPFVRVGNKNHVISLHTFGHPVRHWHR